MEDCLVRTPFSGSALVFIICLQINLIIYLRENYCLNPELFELLQIYPEQKFLFKYINFHFN